MSEWAHQMYLSLVRLVRLVGNLIIFAVIVNWKPLHNIFGTFDHFLWFFQYFRFEGTLQWMLICLFSNPGSWLALFFPNWLLICNLLKICIDIIVIVGLLSFHSDLLISNMVLKCILWMKVSVNIMILFLYWLIFYLF